MIEGIEVRDKVVSKKTGIAYDVVAVAKGTDPFTSETKKIIIVNFQNENGECVERAISHDDIAEVIKGEENKNQ